MNLMLGCIADDLTGATDLGLLLTQHGMPTSVIVGEPATLSDVATPAAVVALKSRTVAADVASQAAAGAARWLLRHGAGRLYFKYCSTFDSTDAGNIGPVAECLLDCVGEDFTVLVPAYPQNGRTVRDGILYVHGVPLAESPMRDHPLTPMRQSSLVSLMDEQTSAGRTGVVKLEIVRRGADAINAELQRLRAQGTRYAAIDAEQDEDITNIAEACTALGLLTGGAAFGGALASVLRRHGLLEDLGSPEPLPRVGGNAAVLAGSCSKRTWAQVGAFEEHAESIRVDPLELAADNGRLAAIVADAVAAAGRGDVIVSSSSTADRMREVQQKLGTDVSAKLVENAFAEIAAALADVGISKMIIAGGETSGAVAAALSIDSLVVGPQIDTGVPWMVRRGDRPMCIAFKSGNFGTEDFFDRALELLR